MFGKVPNEPGFDSGSEERNNLSNISPNLMEQLHRSSSSNASRRSEVAVPILHSSRESADSGTVPRRMEAIRVDPLPGALPIDVDELEQNQPRIRANVHPYRHPLPKPSPFEGKGDRKIEHFLITYERYSKSMWGENEENWVAGLESLLQGWALVLYRALCEQGKNYSQIKQALLAAFPGLVDPFRTRNVMNLLNLKRQANEPLSVFYLRVETTISEAYPHLEGYSLSIQVRDTFLMKLDPDIATKVATYCSNRGNFEPAMVREAASMVITHDFSNLNRGMTSEDVMLLQQPVQAQHRTEKQIPKSTVDLRCYICAVAWHPVSACSLYPTIFSCPLCRQEPHPVTQCHLYEEWKQIKAQMRSQEYERRNQDHVVGRTGQMRYVGRNDRPSPYITGRQGQSNGSEGQRRNSYYEDGPQRRNNGGQRPYQEGIGYGRQRPDRTDYAERRTYGRNEGSRNEVERPTRFNATPRNSYRQGNF